MELKDEITETLRRAALASGRTAYALSRAAKTSYAAMWMFTRGKSDLKLTAAGRLAHVLGLELRKKRKGQVEHGKHRKRSRRA